MKRAFLAILSVIGLFCANVSIIAAENKPAEKVIAYYFHSTFRCFTCTTMEKYTREAIETNFKDALASGSLEFKTINIEERGNEHFADDYKLYTKSLILSSVKGGREIRSKNLNKIWDYARSRQKFIDYVTAEINAFMKDTQ